MMEISVVETEKRQLSFLEEEKIRKKMRFAVKRIPYITAQGEQAERGLIVLEYEEVPIKITTLHKYCTGVTNVSLNTQNNIDKENMICKFLNEIMFNNYLHYGVDKLSDITKETIQYYLNHYEEMIGQTVAKETLSIKMYTICHFMASLAYEKMSDMTVGELFTPQIIYKDGRAVTINVCTLKIRKSKGKIFHSYKDLSEKGLNMLISLAWEHMPYIALCIMLQAYGGLRRGEVCNTRRYSSPYGHGIVFTSRTCSIDLRNRFQMRDDMVDVGGIKRYRIQSIYPDYVEVIRHAYQMHMKMIYEQYDEKQFDYSRPLFVTQRGKALTSRAYGDAFKKLVSTYLVPTMRDSGDIELQLEAELIASRGMTTHALRHFFSKMLAKAGLSMAEIQFYRGDNSPESAFVYLNKKGVTNDAIKKVKEKANQTLIDNYNEKNEGEEAKFLW